MPLPYIDPDTLESMGRRLRDSAMTIAELHRATRLQERTIYRYLARLDQLGWQVARRKRPDGQMEAMTLRVGKTMKKRRTPEKTT